MESIKMRGRVRVRLMDGTERTCPYFDFEDQVWFVPEWMDGTVDRPARIISLNDLLTKNPDLPTQGIDWEIVEPLDNAVFEGRRLSGKPRVIPMPKMLLDWGE